MLRVALFLQLAFCLQPVVEVATANSGALDVNLEVALRISSKVGAFLVDCSFVTESCMSVPPVKSGLHNSAAILCALDDIWTREAEKDQNGQCEDQQKRHHRTTQHQPLAVQLRRPLGTLSGSPAELSFLGSREDFR
jgi:hypothetical protein